MSNYKEELKQEIKNRLYSSLLRLISYKIVRKYASTYTLEKPTVKPFNSRMIGDIFYYDYITRNNGSKKV